MEFRLGSIYVRQAPRILDTGHVIEGHKHNFDHTTFFCSGKWKVELFGDVSSADGTPVMGADGEPLRVKLRETTVQGGVPHSFLLIEADKYHRLTVLEGPACFACIYSHRTEEGDVTPEYTGWETAYV